MTSPSTPSTAPTKALLDRLHAHGRAVRWLAVLKGSVTFFGVVLALIAGSFVLDRWLGLGAPVRIGLGLIALATIVVVLWRKVLGPLRVPADPLDLAAATDRAVGGAENTFLTQRFATLLDLESKIDDEEFPESRELMRQAVDQSRHELADVRYDDYLDMDRAGQRGTLAAFFVLIPLFLALAHPDIASLWFKRWFLGSEERWPQQTYLVLDGYEDGRLIVPRGEPVDLRVRAREGSVVPDEVEIRYALDDAGRERGIMTRFAANDFRYRIPGVQKQGDVWLYGGDEAAGPLRIVAKPRPHFVSFTLLADLPEADSREELAFETQDRDLAFRAETRMTLRVTVDQPVAPLVLPSAQAEGVTVEQPTPETMVLTWRHRRRMTFSLAVTSAETTLISRPRTLTFGLTEDDAPRVTLDVEGVRERVTPTATVPVRLLVRDDFGITGVGLDVRKGNTPNLRDVPVVEMFPLFVTEPDDELPTSTERAKDLELGPYELAPGAFVQLLGTADDRCHLGPQTGRSRPRVLRIVEPTQLLREITVRLESARGRFRTAWNGARETASQLGQMEELANVDELLRRHRVLERQVWAANRVFQASIRELRLNKLVELEADLILQRQVLDPLDTLYRGRVREQRSGLESALKGEETPVTDVAERQQAIVKNMKKILDGMQRWDSFVDLINQLDEVISLQKDTRRATLGGEAEKDDERKK